MRALLDTHVLLWWAADDPRLSPRARELLRDPANELLFSVANHHRDPFDRILVAQSQLEKLPILTADPLIARYPVEIIW